MLESILVGKGNMYCQFCGGVVEKIKEEKHFQGHSLMTKNVTKKSLFEVPKELENYIGNQMLLGRSEYEYELEFDRESVYTFTKFFKV